MSVFWERGSPDFPACGLRRVSKEAHDSPSSSTQAQDPREGPSLAGRTTRSFLRHGLVRLAHEEVESSRLGTSRGAHDASHHDRDQAGTTLHSVLVSSLVQRGQAQARSTVASKKVTISVQQDQDQPNGRKEVILEPKQASSPESLTGEDQL